MLKLYILHYVYFTIKKKFMKKKKTIRRSQKDHIRPDNIGSLWPSEGILEYTGKSLKFAENSEFILILSVY